jgi:hypothetical protein
MKLGVAAIAFGIGLLATPALAQTADQAAAICDFLQTGMIHRDENFQRIVAGPPDENGAYPLARPYAWPGAGCAIVKDRTGRWQMVCTWGLDGVGAGQAQQALGAVGDQVTACIGAGYQRSLTDDGTLIFSLNGQTRVGGAMSTLDGRQVVTLSVFGPDPSPATRPSQ